MQVNAFVEGSAEPHFSYGPSPEPQIEMKDIDDMPVGYAFVRRVTMHGPRLNTRSKVEMKNRRLGDAPSAGWCSECQVDGSGGRSTARRSPLTDTTSDLEAIYMRWTD